jgi:hypothetical protein
VLVSLAALVLAIGGCASPSVKISPSPTARASATINAPSAVPSSSIPPPLSERWIPMRIGGVSVRDVSERNGLLVAVGNPWSLWPSPPGAGVVAVSDDGENWRWVDLARLPFHSLDLSGFNQVVAGPAGLLAAGGGGNLIDDVCCADETSFLLLSADGLAWDEIPCDQPCSVGGTIVGGQFGYLAYGARYSESGVQTAPFRIFTSRDGRDWTLSTADFQATYGSSGFGSVATNGTRLVGVSTYDGNYAAVWISDDGGRTWRNIEPSFSRVVTPYWIAFGHGRFIIGGSVATEGDAIPHVCTSPDGETWECHQIPVQFLRAPAVTPTGFVSVSDRSKDEGRYSHAETVVSTSADGSSWIETVASQVPELRFYGEAWTTHGLVAWGGTNPDVDITGYSVPFVLLHQGVLP